MALAPSPSMTAAARRRATRGEQPMSLERFVAIQEEIAYIDRRIAQLQSGDAAGAAIAAPPFSGAASEDGQSAEVLRHIRAVELCQLAAAGDLEGVAALLAAENSVGPNCADYDGRTPLHLAALFGHAAVVRLLVAHQACVSAVDEDGKTAAQLADEEGHAEISNELAALETVEPDSFADREDAQPSLAVSGTPDDALPGGQSPPPLGPDGLPLAAVAAAPKPRYVEAALVVIMVGLPGRGKTYVAQHVHRYFQWTGHHTLMLSHQLYRKRVTGTAASFPKEIPDAETRTSDAISADVARTLRAKGGVVVLDGTHSTPARRWHLWRAILDRQVVTSDRIVFVEVVNSDPALIRANVLRARDAAVSPPESFVADYYENMRQHERVYQTLTPATDRDFSFIRIENQATLHLNRVQGWMPSRLAYLLHNLRHAPVDLYLTRSGLYEDRKHGRIGGDSRLTPEGEAYARALFEHLAREMRGAHFEIMSSCARRCQQTLHLFIAAASAAAARAQRLRVQGSSGEFPPHATPPPADPSVAVVGVPPDAMTPTTAAPRGLDDAEEVAGAGGEGGLPPVRCRVGCYPTLDDLNHGDCEGQLLSEIRRTLPNTMATMDADPYTTAWPSGESLHQLFSGRLEPHLHDIHAASQPLVICSHRSVLQGIYSYFVRRADGTYVEPRHAHTIDIPLHAVIRLRHVHDARVAEVTDLSARVNEILAEQQQQQQHE